jgi:hypothetical protein
VQPDVVAHDGVTDVCSCCQKLECTGEGHFADYIKGEVVEPALRYGLA